LISNLVSKSYRKARQIIHSLIRIEEYLRERHAVNKGNAVYRANNKKGNPYRLRRNIHRLEKGLIMSPRRRVFAEKYINVTVKDYKALLNRFKSDEVSQLLQWAHDVLVKYFEVTDSSTSSIKKPKSLFESLEEKKLLSNIPRARFEYAQSPIHINDLKLLAKQRRSVRWFQDKKVPREVVESAMEVGLQAPSACNRQPYTFLYYDDEELVSKISACPMGTAGFAQNFKSIILAVGDLSAYEHSRDRHLIYIDTSLCAMGFITALETVGLSSCVINWPDLPEKEKLVRKLVPLKDYQRIVFMIAVGYASEEGGIPYSAKKQIDEVMLYNRRKND